DPALWQQFVLELKRVIRGDGLVCIIEHNPLNPMTRLAVFRCPFDKDAQLLRASQARGFFAHGGLEHLRTKHFLLTPFFSAPVLTIERWLSTVPLGAQYMAVGERPLSDSKPAS